MDNNDNIIILEDYTYTGLYALVNYDKKDEILYSSEFIYLDDDSMLTELVDSFRDIIEDKLEMLNRDKSPKIVSIYQRNDDILGRVGRKLAEELNVSYSQFTDDDDDDENISIFQQKAQEDELAGEYYDESIESKFARFYVNLIHATRGKSKMVNGLINSGSEYIDQMWGEFLEEYREWYTKKQNSLDDFDFEEIKSMLYTLTSLTDLVFNYVKQYKEAGIIHKENEWSVKRITDTIKQFNKTNEYPDDTPEYVKTIQVSLKMNVSDAFVEEKKRTDVQKLIKTENKWGGTEWELKETTDPDYVKNYGDFGKDFNGN